jgi:orc1/cdc6 family replication initiation protein
MTEDARVLREGFVPKDVIHRDHEVNALSRVLDPLARGEPTEPALVSGPSGVGKTTITKFVVSHLREEVLDVVTVHLNCWQAYSRFKATYEVLRELGESVDIRRQSTPHDELLNRLNTYEGPPVIVVLDEADQLEDARLIYDLYRLPRFAMILVTNDEEQLLSGLDDRVRSRLHTAETVHFDSYHTRELVDILAARIDHGLVHDAVSDEKLHRMADAAGGDARVGLSILRSAARQADQESVERLSDDHVEAAIPEGRNEVRTKNLNTLRSQQRDLYEILVDAGELAPKELYDCYCERVEDPRTKRTMRSWLQKLAHYDLVAASGEGPSRTYAATAEYADSDSNP